MRAMTRQQERAVDALAYLAGSRRELHRRIDELTISLRKRPTVSDVLKDIQNHPPKKSRMTA